MCPDMRRKMKFRNLFTLIPFFLFLFQSEAPAFVVDVTPTFSVEEEYTDNMDNVDEGKEEEFITTISSGVQADLKGETSEASLSYTLGYALYSRFEENDSIRHNAAVSAAFGLTRRTSLQLSDNFLYTEEPNANLTEEVIEDATIRKGREPYYQNSTNISLYHQFGKADSFSIGYGYRFLENEDPDVEDNSAHEASFSLGYDLLPPRLRLETGLAYTKGEFSGESEDVDYIEGNIRLIRRFKTHFAAFLEYTHSMVDYSGVSEDYQVYAPSAGIVWSPTKTMNIDLGVGYMMQDGDESDNYESFFAEGSIDNVWDFRRGSIRLSGIGGSTEAFFGAENLGFNIYYGADCQMTYALTKRINAQLQAAYRRDRYEEPDATRRDNTWRVGPGIAFQITKWLFLTLDYSYINVDSSDSENSYAENRVFMALKLSPSTPYRILK